MIFRCAFSVATGNYKFCIYLENFLGGQGNGCFELVKGDVKLPTITAARLTQEEFTVTPNIKITTSVTRRNGGTLELSWAQLDADNLTSAQESLVTGGLAGLSRTYTSGPFLGVSALFDTNTTELGGTFRCVFVHVLSFSPIHACRLCSGSERVETADVRRIRAHGHGNFQQQRFQ